MHNTQEQDIRFMQQALRAAVSGMGRCAPNPSVGAVLVGHHTGAACVLAVARTADGGRPHAETRALHAAPYTKGATLYVTLEPCAHHGHTPPCAQAIIDAEVGSVVIGVEDADPRVAGRGAAMLRAAGIAVRYQPLGDRIRTFYTGFLQVRTQQRPYVSLKIATTLDGKIAMEDGSSRWITGEKARHYGHMLRARHDAILTGSGTWRHDAPSLDCRLPGLAEASPMRAVWDRSSTLDALPDDVLHLRTPTLHAALMQLAEAGACSVLLEGGAGLCASAIQEGCIDQLYWFHAPLILGAEALSACAPLPHTALDAVQRWHIMENVELGADRLLVLRP